MLYVNCELPTEPQEHFTLWTTVTKSEPSYRTQLTGGWSRTRQRRSNAKPLLLKWSTLAQGVCRRLRHADTRPPRRYGFPKIHKEGVPYCKQCWGPYLQAVEALCYKPEGRGFDSQWCHWNFSLS